MPKDKPDSITQTSRVEVPDFLKPFMRQAAGTSGRALSGLESQILGSSGGLQLPQGARIENGRVVRDVSVPGTGLGGFGGSQLGGRQLPGGGLTVDQSGNIIPFGGGTQTIDLGPVSQFRQQGTQPDLVAGFDPLEEQAFGLAEARARGEGGFIPTFQNQLLGISQGRGLQGLLPESAFNALNQTAGGEFLFGGPGFDQAVQAAVRAAQPGIFSTFGGAGRGTGGLAQAAVGEAATDAFSRLFNQERARQMGAASALSELQNAELGRQLQAIGVLPEAATIDADILQAIGAARRQQAQKELTAPIAAFESLLASSQGGPGSFSSLFGASESRPLFRNPTAGVLGGASTGLALSKGLGLGGLTALSGNPLASGVGLTAPIPTLGLNPAGIGLTLGGALLGGSGLLS